MSCLIPSLNVSRKYLYDLKSYANSISSLINKYMIPTIGDKLIINLKIKDLMLVQQKVADLGYFIHLTKENIDNNR